MRERVPGTTNTTLILLPTFQLELSENKIFFLVSGFMEPLISMPGLLRGSTDPRLRTLGLAKEIVN